ncbi:MAG: NHL repeat-containing protein [Leptospirillum sp.]
MKPLDHCVKKWSIFKKSFDLLKDFRLLFIGISLVLLAACGGGSSGGGGGGGGATTPTNTGGTPGSSNGSSTSGLTSSLWINQAYATFGSNGSISNPVSNLLYFKNMATQSSPTNVYNQTSYVYGWMLPDNSGNLWANEVQIPSASNGGIAPTIAIVKFSNVTSNPSSLSSPTVVYNLPANVFVQSLAFDSSNNLYFDEESTTGSQGMIIKLAGPSYSSPTTLLTYSPSGGSNCTPSAYLAFDGSGNLWAAENYYNGTSCNNQISEINSSTGSVINNYGTLSGNEFSILFDSSGNMWGLQKGCQSGCSPTTASIWKWTGTPASGNPTTPLLSLPSGIEPAGSSGQAVFDGNGNLWFNAQYNTGSCPNTNSCAFVYELANGATTLTPAFTYGQNNYLSGIAVAPPPTSYPVN